MTGATKAILVQTMVDAGTLIEHLIDLDTITTARSRGCYPALCGVDVLAASMTTKERGFCRECLRRQVDRCT
ncbi:MAG: hypothetical protein ACRDTC_11620 [Pseudonocardiaceae bacterium]